MEESTTTSQKLIGQPLRLKLMRCERQELNVGQNPTSPRVTWKRATGATKTALSPGVGYIVESVPTQHRKYGQEHD